MFGKINTSIKLLNSKFFYTKNYDYSRKTFYFYFFHSDIFISDIFNGLTCRNKIFPDGIEKKKKLQYIFSYCSKFNLPSVSNYLLAVELPIRTPADRQFDYNNTITFSVLCEIKCKKRAYIVPTKCGPLLQVRCSKDMIE